MSLESIALFAGSDAGEVIAAIDRWPSSESGHDSATSIRYPLPEGPVRLAIVDPDPRRLELARRVVERGTAWRARSDLWFTSNGLVSGGGKIAFVYPGFEPGFPSSIGEVFAQFGTRSFGAPVDDHQGLGLVAVGLVLTDVMKSIGVQPDEMAGHSLGEWTGMVASELIPPGLVADQIARLQVGSLNVPDVLYLALGCSAEMARGLIADIGGAAVSHDNCPHQSVVCGTGGAIEVIRERAADRKVIAEELPFHSGMHSAMFAPFAAPLLDYLAGVPVQEPRTPMWSATTAGRYPTGRADVLQLAADHLVTAVRFRELIENMHHDGVRVFVQLGLGSLTGFIADTLTGSDHLTIAAAKVNRPVVAQLCRVAAAMWVEGVAVDVEPLMTGLGSPEVAVTGTSLRSAPTSVGPGTSPRYRTDASTPFGPPAAIATTAGVERRDRVEEAYAALAEETQQAARDVLDAWRSRRPSRAGSLHHGPPGRVRGSVAGSGTHTSTVRLGLDTQPWLIDHAFFQQAPGWSDASDRFPVVPMTGMIEQMVDAATALLPGWIAVSVRDVRAMRWLPVEPPVEVDVIATLGDADTVRVALSGYARGTVQLARTYPPPPPCDHLVTGSRPLPLRAEQLYDQRWMFHGPRFQGVRAIATLGDDGLEGEIEMLASPGAFLDQSGQLLGYWIQAVATENFFAFPQRVDAVDWFAPYPPIGTSVRSHIRVLEMSEREVRSDHELSVDGSVIVRLRGWSARRFDSDRSSLAAMRWPERTTLSKPLAPGVTVIEEAWPDSATRELMMRRYLGASERAEYETHHPRAQRHRLLGRIAAKDVVREHLWDRGLPDMYPAEVEITNDEDGRPMVAGPGAGDLVVSIAHTDWLGAAIVASGQKVGIDAEVVDVRSSGFEGAVLGEQERTLADPLLRDDRSLWLTRIWSAKEAAAKATGRGLAGRPHGLPLEAVDGDRLLVAGRWIVTVVHEGRLTHPDGAPRRYVIAWTELSDD